MATLKTLQAGEQLAGGAQLPMSDETLRMVLRQQRHELKAGLLLSPGILGEATNNRPGHFGTARIP